MFFQQEPLSGCKININIKEFQCRKVCQYFHIRRFKIFSPWSSRSGLLLWTISSIFRTRST